MFVTWVIKMNEENEAGHTSSINLTCPPKKLGWPCKKKSLTPRKIVVVSPNRLNFEKGKYSME